MSLPEVGETVQFWRRDPGGRSQLVTAVVLETIEPSWCYIRRVDTGEERQIDPSRLMRFGVEPERKEKPLNEKLIERLADTIIPDRSRLKGKDQ